MNTLTEQQALSKLAALCSRGEHCQGEMHEKLRRWAIDGETAERIVQYLVEHRYIDDERYARAFAHDKLQYNGWGRRKIEQALRGKRVAAEIIERVLAATATDDYEERLRPLLAAKRKSIKAKDERELTMKLIRFAMGRGFSYDQISHCLDTDVADDY